MKSKKLRKPTKQDKGWQQNVEGQIKAERVELDHPKGKERFERVIEKLDKKESP